MSWSHSSSMMKGPGGPTACWSTRALNEELRPVKMNYEIHGNTIPHLHLHLYPRTAEDPFVGQPIDGAARLLVRSPEDLERLHRVILTAAG